MVTRGHRPAAQPTKVVLASVARVFGPVLGLVVLAQSAAAVAEVNLTAKGTTGAGVTDNVASGTTGSANTKFGAVALVNGSLDGTWTGATHSQDLRYTYGLTRSLSSNGHQTQTQSLIWNGNFTPSGRVTYSASTSATLSRMDAINVIVDTPLTSGLTDSTAAAPPTDTLVGTPFPSATMGFLSLAAYAGATWRPTPDVAWSTTTSAHTLIPTAGPQLRTSYGVDETISHDRSLGLNALLSSVQFGVLVAKELRDSLGNVLYPEAETLHGRVLVGWRRSLSPFLDATVAVGGLGAMSPAGGPIVVGPSARATMNYIRDFAAITAEYDHAPVPSLFLGRMSVSDRVMAHVTMPLDRAGRFSTVGMGNYSHARFMDATNHLTPGSDILTASVGVACHPLLWPISFSLHYTRLQQVSHPIDGTQTLPTIERQTLMFVVTGVWSRYPAGGAAAGGGS